MKFKFPICSLALCALFGLSACSDSSSSSGDVSNSSSSVSIVVPGSSSGGAQSEVGRLPATANAQYPDALYPVWKDFHYITLEDEATRYPNWGAEFGEIFAPYIAQGLSAGRVIWSTSTNNNCWIDEASGSPMYKRGCTVSEGIGYGMLITVFAGDWDAFNRLWIYSKAYRNTPYAGGNGLMPWLTASFSWTIPDDASATDADLDIATSLIVAYYMTGNSAYLEDALTLVAALWEHEINKSNLLIYSGDTPMWTGSDPVYNLSYFSPVALRLFAMVDPNHDWTGVLNAEYAYMQQVQKAGTGVFPDWSNGAGVAVNPNNNSADKTYWTFNKESVRIPWRLAWDYYWFQDDRAAQVLNTLNSFISAKSGGDPVNLPATNFTWNESAGPDIVNSRLSLHWKGAWCLTAMAGADSWMDACAADFNAQIMETSASSYFINILHIMMSQLMNGKYVKPF